MEERQQVKHLRTTGTIAPTSTILPEGEIALGQNPSLPRIWEKLSDDTIVEYIPKSVMDDIYAKKEDTNAYELVLNDDGSLQCIKNGNEEGFVLNDDGSLVLG